MYTSYVEGQHACTYFSCRGTTHTSHVEGQHAHTSHVEGQHVHTSHVEGQQMVNSSSCPQGTE